MQPRATKVGLVLVGLVVGLFLGEAGLRLFAPQVHRTPRVWEYDRLLGWRHIPGASGILKTPEFEVILAINQDGLRDAAHEPRPEPGTRRILAFGDSFVEGWGVRLEASVSKRIQERLTNQVPRRRFEVLNFGVAGYGTDQELLYFQTRGRSFGPARVLVFFYANDLWNNVATQGIGTERGPKPFFHLGPDGELVVRGVPVPRSSYWDPARLEGLPWHRRLDRYLGGHLHVRALVTRALADPEVGEEQRRRYYEALYGEDPEGRWQSMWDVSARLLAVFRERVEQAGARLLVVYVPAIVQVEEDNWRAKREVYGLVHDLDLDRPNRRLAAAAASSGVALLDLCPGFRKEAQRQVLYYRDSHWNEAGHAVAAELVAQALAEEESRALP